MSTPVGETFAKPDLITGGCLCGLVRYKVEFPKDHNFLQSSGSCQCTQCRRNTGSLVLFSHEVPLRCLTYMGPTPSLRIYNATPGIQRGFCSECGSYVYWRDESCDNVELAVGCFDPEFLIGKEGKGGYGLALASMSGHNVHCENEIRGVTDEWIGKRGERWLKGSSDKIKAP